VAGVKALAYEMPAEAGAPLARWTCPELARKTASSGISPAPSASTVRRWLADDALKPWQHRSWIFPRDPRFAEKAARVLDLYQREWEGRPLGEDEYVLSSDEKPGVQARSRRHLPLPLAPRRAMRAESEYGHLGTLTYHPSTRDLLGDHEAGLGPAGDDQVPQLSVVGLDVGLPRAHPRALLEELAGG
jgi:hypothetical protein